MRAEPGESKGTRFVQVHEHALASLHLPAAVHLTRKIVLHQTITNSVALRLPAGSRSIELSSPSDHLAALLPLDQIKKRETCRFLQIISVHYSLEGWNSHRNMPLGGCPGSGPTLLATALQAPPHCAAPPGGPLLCSCASYNHQPSFNHPASGLLFSQQFLRGSFAPGGQSR